MIGSGASTTIIDGGRAATVVTIPKTSTSVILSRMTIRNGLAQSGGGIYSLGTLTIYNITVSGNAAAQTMCYPFCSYGTGGGIYNGGRLTINKSTVNGNVASEGCRLVFNRGPHFICFGGTGGGIYSSPGTLIISNSTISGNAAMCSNRSGCVKASPGGGIYSSPGTLTISNSTISRNDAGIGGGISGLATLQNSIVAYNSRNCYGTMTSNGYNLSSDGTCNFNGPGDMNNTNPMLGTLGNNGGPTQTIPLLPGSPAIDAGNPKTTYQGPSRSQRLGPLEAG